MTGIIGKIKAFFNEVKIEGKKVNYPQREELIGSTWVVIVTVFAMSFYLGGVDFILAKIVNLMIR
ncbi:MAG TPA: preprotein translocase subunit SecE [Dissulfurispiraceae bacterium]|nr:preprotein translocase subunit SecE [Dissulfurispiraceae bacterium]